MMAIHIVADAQTLPDPADTPPASVALADREAAN
jgi:hypothetical protein